MKTKICKTCIYCISLTRRPLQVFICSNRHNSPGRLTLTDPKDSCSNFKAKQTVNRPTVTQPTDCDIRFIPLTQGKVAIVDAEDYDWLSQYKWYANKKASGYYACTRKNSKVLYMHRLIMQTHLSPRTLGTSSSLIKNCHRLGDGMVVDHIDRNPLNNRRSNLRFCTPRQNCFNQRPKRGTSKYKGVYWHKKQKNWAAIIEMNNKSTHLGFFKNESDAARAYDKIAQKIFGEFAYLNFDNPRIP